MNFRIQEISIDELITEIPSLSLNGFADPIEGYTWLISDDGSKAQLWKNNGGTRQETEDEYIARVVEAYHEFINSQNSVRTFNSVIEGLHPYYPLFREHFKGVYTIIEDVSILIEKAKAEYIEQRIDIAKENNS
uniref:Uncharacterized protein n=1 Tax=Ochrobactrum phage ORM_20 TaxID=2985243 RepID=A0A9N6WSL9_9VIRU|nr:hypothetical protein ORM20_00127 [Ochrobactrum phage ORM_20]